MNRLAVTLTALVASAAAAVPPPPPTMPCTWDSGKGASYDLSKLQELTSTDPATFHDRMQVAQKDYLYTFSICGNVAAPKNCQNADGTSIVDPYWAPAWQTNATQTSCFTDPLNPNKGKCHCFYLGNNDFKEYAKWSLLDTENPGAGVSLTYTHGQHCSNGQRRAMKLNFKCSMTAQIEKFEQNVIDESAHCEYAITIESEYACPTQCGFGGGQKMCNAHGVCGFDSDAKTARCFCNEGYSGSGCDKTPEKGDLSGYGAILGLLIFITIALVGLGAGIAYLFRYLRERTVPMEGDAYARLDNDGSGATSMFSLSVSGDDNSFAPARMDVKGADNL